MKPKAGVQVCCMHRPFQGCGCMLPTLPSIGPRRPWCPRRPQPCEALNWVRHSAHSPLLCPHRASISALSSVSPHPPPQPIQLFSSLQCLKCFIWLCKKKITLIRVIYRIELCVSFNISCEFLIVPK